jgi:hypothetical protein
MKAPSWLGALFLCLPERGAHLLTSSGNLAIAALSQTLKATPMSSTDQGGGKRRGGTIGYRRGYSTRNARP